MRVKGRDVVVYCNSKEIGYSTACDVQVSCDIAEFTSALSGNAKRHRPGRYSWQVSFDALVENSVNTDTSILSLALSRSTVVVAMSIPMPDGSLRTLSGNACIQTWQQSGAIGSMATYKVSMVGDGELSISGTA